MVKATLRSAVLLFLVALGMLATSMPSFAETQNVKVGGDITVRGFMRKNLDLRDQDGGLDGDNFIQQTVGLNVGADLTENVSTFIRLANESRWGALGGVGGSTGGTAPAASNDDGDFGISQGYVKFKDLFYAPLTLTVGRQPIVWGRGFVLGSTLIPGIFAPGDRHNAIDNDEFTDFTAFDAARATLDFSGAAAVDLPLTVDLVYAKLGEAVSGTADDVNLMGFNIGTRMDVAEVEAYYLNKNDKSPDINAGVATDVEDSSINTIGIRGSAKPVEGSNFYAELAYQWGTRGVDFDGNGDVIPSGDSQQAWAFDIGAEMGFKDVPTSPMIGGEWIFFSGSEVGGIGSQGWDPITRGYFTTAIREFQTGAASGFYGTDQVGDTSAQTNQHQLSVYGSLKPLEDLNVQQRLSWFVLDNASNIGGQGANSKRASFAGTEWDTVATYNYTDDVQFQAIYAIFWPGSVYRTDRAGTTFGDDTAQELVSSVSVKF